MDPRKMGFESVNWIELFRITPTGRSLYSWCWNFGCYYQI